MRVFAATRPFEELMERVNREWEVSEV